MNRIVGGTPVGVQDYPFYAFPESGYYCGSTAIHSDVLLTAAHCIPAVWSEGLWVGGNNMNGRNSKFYTVNRTVMYPFYNDNSSVNDIRLIKVNGFIPEPYAQLNTDRAIPAAGDAITVIGYGRTTEGGETSDELLQVNVAALSYSECNKTYHKSLVNSIMFCNGGPPEGGKDSCQGK
jgi:secreted trypsin-like serine protease